MPSTLPGTSERSPDFARLKLCLTFLKSRFANMVNPLRLQAEYSPTESECFGPTEHICIGVHIQLTPNPHSLNSLQERKPFGLGTL
jgi:hypothetical protein